MALGTFGPVPGRATVAASSSRSEFSGSRRWPMRQSSSLHNSSRLPKNCAGVANMLSSTTDLLQLRWRSAQLLAAVAQGNKRDVRALLRAMEVEGINPEDRRDEIALLLAQFGRRPTAALGVEIGRLWLKLRQLP